MDVFQAPQVGLPCLCSLCASRVCVPYVSMCLRAFASHMPSFFSLPYVPSYFTCLMCFNIFTCLSCPYLLSALRALRAIIFLHAFTFLSVSNFRRGLCIITFHIKCETTHKQPQQAGISKNEVE